MRTLSIILIMFMLFSCKKNEPQSLITFGGIFFDTDVYLFVRDSQGNDLLNPANPKAYDQSTLRIFQAADGKMAELPKNTNYQMVSFVAQHDTLFCLRLTCSATNYIAWSKAETDTLTCLMNSNHGLRLQTASYNGKSVDFTNPWNIWHGFTVVKK